MYVCLNTLQILRQKEIAQLRKCKKEFSFHMNNTEKGTM